MPETHPSAPAQAASHLWAALLPRSKSPGEEARIARVANEETLRMSRPLMLVACAVALLWWPLDLALYADRPEVVRWFALWRGAVVVIGLLFVGLGYRSAWARRHHAACATAVGATLAFIIAGCLGALGGMGQPWFASLYLAPLMGFPFLVRLPTRLAGTAAIAAAAFAGFFGLHPGHVADPGLGTAVGLMAFSAVIAASAGHANYLRFRQSQRQAVLLERHADELETLSESLAARVAESTRELRELATHMQDLLETERGAIAGELHDDLGQLLYGMHMELDLAQLDHSEGRDVAESLTRLAGLVEATLQSARSILSRLRPRILDDLGLVAALEWLVADTRRRAPVPVSFAAAPPGLTVADDVGTAVFRIVQEALTNALRHADAAQVQVHLSHCGDTLTVRVVDDGKGLPPPEARRQGALGLVGIRERAASLGGRLELQLPASGGTCVQVTLPTPNAGVTPGEST